MWYHFRYESGGNPYICRTSQERDKILKKYEREGVAVTVEERSAALVFYVIHDKEA